MTQRSSARVRLLAALAVCALVAACATTAENTAASLAEERAVSQELLGKLRDQNALVTDPEVTAYVQGVVRRVAAKRPQGAVPTEAHVVADATVNAFTTGAGYLFINLGLLAAMENEAQFATVVAHEIAHVDGGHIAAGKSNRQAVGALGGLAKVGAAVAGLGALGDAGVELGASYAANSFSRAQETDADTVGFGYANAAGYDMTEGAQAFEVLRRIYGSQGGLAAAFFSSHPQSADRQANLAALAAESGTGGYVGKAEHDAATVELRRAVLRFLEAEGRSTEAAQVRKNLAN